MNPGSSFLVVAAGVVVAAGYVFAGGSYSFTAYFLVSFFPAVSLTGISLVLDFK